MRLLISEGVGAVKISRLCELLGVTKGSFYWHFTDIGALMSTLADHCRSVQADAMRTLAGLGALPPVERIRAMGDLVSDTRRRSVETAVRAWAETDAALARSVIALDNTVFDVAHKAFMELGFGEVDAHARATTLVYVGIGYMAGGKAFDIATDDDKRILIELLTRI